MATRKRRKKKSGLKYNKVVVALLLLSVAAFTVTMIVVYIRTGGVPDTLVTAFFMFAGSEAGFLGLIKYSDNKFTDGGTGSGGAATPPAGGDEPPAAG